MPEQVQHFAAAVTVQLEFQARNLRWGVIKRSRLSGVV